MTSKIHQQALVPPTKDYILMMYIYDEECVDMHLIVGGEFVGHISEEMWTIIQEEELRSLEQIKATAEYCDDCFVDDDEDE